MLKTAKPVEGELILQILQLRKLDNDSLQRKLERRDEKINNLRRQLKQASSRLYDFSRKNFTSLKVRNNANFRFLEQNFPDTYTKFVKKYLEQAKQKLDEQETATALTQMRQPVSSSSGQKRKRGPKAVLESKMQASLLF